MSARSIDSRPLILGKSGLFAIRSTPCGGTASLGLVVLNSGMLPAMGPFRVNAQLAEALGDLPIATVRVDQSGKGESPPRGDLTPSEAALSDYDEVLANLQRVGVEETILMGICSGAVDALRIAAKRDSVVGLVLIDGYVERTAGWYWHRAARRLRNGITAGPWAALRKLKARQTSSSGTTARGLKDDLRFWRSLKLHQCYAEVFDRGVSVLSIFTGYFWPYNHEGQMRRYLSSLDLRKFQEIRFDEADHTFTLGKDRRRLVATIRGWLVDNFVGGR